MRSDDIKKGLQRAPHRSLLKALGITDEEMNKPFVGIVNSFNELVPGHTNLREIVEAVKKEFLWLEVYHLSFQPLVYAMELQ
nr:dihydroxy-acid dehydratase [Caloramator sp. E03]